MNGAEDRAPSAEKRVPGGNCHDGSCLVTAFAWRFGLWFGNDTLEVRRELQSDWWRPP